MGNPLADSVTIVEPEVRGLATTTKTQGQTIAKCKSGPAAAGVAAGFAGFDIGAACATWATEGDQATATLGNSLDSIGDNVNACIDAFKAEDAANAHNLTNAVK